MIEIDKNDTPLKVAEKLINGYEEEQLLVFTLRPKIFNLAQLEEIATHLNAYVKTQREEEDD